MGTSSPTAASAAAAPSSTRWAFSYTTAWAVIRSFPCQANYTVDPGAKGEPGRVDAANRSSAGHGVARQAALAHELSTL